MAFLEQIVLRFVVWFVLPLALIVLALGPKRVGRWAQHFWAWLWHKRLEPEAILGQVVQNHQNRIAALKTVLARSEAAERDIASNLAESEYNIARLEEEA